MAKYRKKPVIVEAYQTPFELNIETLEGTMHASPGDYIITGVYGEQYPCKPDIFESTYELVEDETKVNPDTAKNIQQKMDELRVIISKRHMDEIAQIWANVKETEK